MNNAIVIAPEQQQPKALAKHEPATAALMAAATASVQSRYLVALQNPRSWDQVRTKALATCKRPGFAERAIWSKPQGGKTLSGPSIRLAEELMRQSGNLDISSQVMSESPTERVLRVTGIDLETNAVISVELTINKTVERREAKDRLVLAQRTNTGGQVVYVVQATEDELLAKVNSAISKAQRTIILKLVPADILEDCLEQCRQTMRSDTKDPAEARRKMCDAFSEIGVMPKDLEAYLGHGLDAMHPNEIQELKGVYAAIRDGEAKWHEVIAEKLGEVAADGEAAPKKKAPTLKDELKAKKDAKAVTPEAEVVDPKTGEVTPAPTREPGAEG